MYAHARWSTPCVKVDVFWFWFSDRSQIEAWVRPSLHSITLRSVPLSQDGCRVTWLAYNAFALKQVKTKTPAAIKILCWGGQLSQRNRCCPNTRSNSLHTCPHARTVPAFKRWNFPEGFASCRSWECSTWTGRVEHGVSWALLSTFIGR